MRAKSRLYYWQDGRTLVFGSEIKALMEYPGISRELDPRRRSPNTFFYGYFPAPRTVYEAIRKLPAAHILIAQGGADQNRMLLAPAGLPAPARSPEPLTAQDERALVDELRTRLRDAAISRLVSDVPLGVFLSGGVDSSTLVALMSELTPGNVNTFSVAFPEKSFNEEPYAELVARHFRTRHHVVRADEPAMRQALQTLADHLDEPVADPAVIPTFLLSRFARAEIKVALSGEGSDELFGGYPTYLGARLAQYYLRLPRVLRRQVFGRLTHFLPVSSTAVPMGLFLQRFLTNAERLPAERHEIWFGMFSPAELDQLFAPGWRGPSPRQRHDVSAGGQGAGRGAFRRHARRNALPRFPPLLGG